MRVAPGILLLICLLGHCEAAGAEVDFSRDIRPLLIEKCFSCHGPDENKREGDLRLDFEASVFGERDAATIVRGKPEESELYQRLVTDDEDLLMPPVGSGKSVSDEEKELLKRWIAEGAAWERHWAHVLPQRNAVPEVENVDWPLNWIDNFILARLEAEGIAPSPEADRITLIRRLSFDLIGLPPTPQEVEQFVNDDDPQAYEKLVDRLLASDHYGERMAMYWLDLVRYADTVGYHGDQDHSISPYRDYVIDAFNDNVPFDQFTREQLAGDLLPDPGNDQKIATGYNRLLQTSHEGGVQPKEYLAIYAADRIRNLSSVWMGVTLGCCQCHNHKYDPFTMKDFYSLIAFFADIDEAQHLTKGDNALPTKRAPEMKLLTKRERQRVAALEATIKQVNEKLAKLEPDQSDEAATLRQQVDELQKQADTVRNSARLTMVTVSIEPRTIRVLPRGDWLDDSGPIVEPAVPEFFGGLDVTDRRATRLDLANWLTGTETGTGGHTARVFANRFWYLLFGQGLVGALDDFGVQGERPSHPGLLDNLAVEFVESGWNVKHMMKLIAMSRTYRQSSLESEELRERDAFNRLVARQSRYRLPAEAVRDNALAVSGLLVTEYGGASVRPYQPTGYYRHLNFPKRTYQHHTDNRQWRRGVYVHWQRQFLHPMLKAFDAPTREECTAQRPRSNTPLAALALLNDTTFVEAARVFAEQIMHEGGDTTEARLDFAFLRAASRQPDAEERELLKQLLSASLEQYEADAKAAEELITAGQAPSANDFNAAELAAWTSVARAILNLNETMTRN